MKKIKVLMSSTNSYTKNGVTNVMLNLFRNIDKTDIRIDFVAIEEPDDNIRLEIEAAKSKITVVPRSIRHFIRFISRFSKVCKGYDIVHVHGNSATIALELFAAKKAGIKTRIAHSHNSTCKFKKLDILCRIPFYALCNGYLACGQKAGEWLFGKRGFQVINNGIDTEKFAFDQKKRYVIRDKLGWHSNKIIGHVGNFVEAKNHTLILDIFADAYQKDNNCRLLLLGDGRLKQDIMKKAQALKIADMVCFVGNTDYVADYLCAMDLVLMPSLFEGLPLALVEEQSNGLKCIVSDAITTDVDLTGNLIFIPLYAEIVKWSNVILNLDIDMDRTLVSNNAIALIKKKGFDSRQSACQLEKYYLEQNLL
ncbi:glycosyltransferase [Oscillospiraceae bacterium LTW-04]|nr:glycosyltransferase [Oscillospiraceae bacterium MB24-C1]